MLTYRELAKLIEQMTPEQQNCPVLFYNPCDGELHPKKESAHPGYDFNTKLIPAEKALCHEYEDPNQLVIEPFLSEEGEAACIRKHMLEVLAKGEDPDPEIQAKREEILRKAEETMFENKELNIDDLLD
jgi:hypothetical protein